MLNINRIITDTRAEGPGRRFCIWVQGCSRHCKGCFAKDTWEHSPRILLNIEDVLKKISNTSGIEGITVLGGEPFEQAKELSQLLVDIKKLNLSVIAFTGYTYEVLKSQNDFYINRFLSCTDVLIDGAYDETQRDITRPLIGSKNQRYIFISDRYKESDFLKYSNSIELCISSNGKISINGMGDFSKIINKLCNIEGEL